MAKLKNYEIDAIYNEIYNKVQELKEAKLKTLKEKIKLNKKQIYLLNILKEINEIEKRKFDLMELGANAYKEVFDTTCTPYSWHRATENDIINHVANKMLPEKMQPANISNIKNRIILANIDGNVQELIDNILAEYND